MSGPIRAGSSARPSTMRPMPRILVVDDEPKIMRLVRDYLEHGGFEVTVARDGPEALMRARTEHPDLVVLDLGLPGLDGLDVTRTLRRDSAVPLIMLTARDTETDKVLGLELGADDYLTKPFSPRELVARIRAVLRRHEPAEADELITVGELVLDAPRLRTEVAGRPVLLTATEFELLATMARQPGRVFTRSQLLDAIHGQALESYERAIDAHVKNIRRKLEPDPRRPRYLLTVYGVGYRVSDAWRPLERPPLAPRRALEGRAPAALVAGRRVLAAAWARGLAACPTPLHGSRHRLRGRGADPAGHARHTAGVGDRLGAGEQRIQRDRR
jgi:DNA-binding response OmpR family regulator